MKKLNYQLKNLCERNHDGSHGTQAERHQILQGIANQLLALGFRRMEANSLKPKHIEALVDHYHQEGLTPGTIKNRMSVLRWWAEKINKSNVICNDNAFYGIADRIFVTNSSKACDLDKALLARIDSPTIKMSLELQKAFGLRREEAMKFTPDYADQGNHIRLKASWCKGGKAREIPIRTDEQRDVLARAHVLAGRGSLIPDHMQYVQQMRIYESETYKAGLSRMHGLRHRYAQERYLALTGWASPACGGPNSQNLNSEERKQDSLARLAISQELGHERKSITSVYLGT
ncbi:MAG: integrase domain-containing protein [Planctomycetaceae bacterium]|nr:integrase domain-containing protein [Planctomycetaceae bacterium]